jgi:hypothetical protein
MADVNDINIHRSPLGLYHIYIYGYISLSYIYIEEVERKGLGRGMGPAPATCRGFLLENLVFSLK